MRVLYGCITQRIRGAHHDEYQKHHHGIDDIKKSTERYSLENITKPMIPTKKVLVLHIQLMPYICSRQEMINEGVIL